MSQSQKGRNIIYYNGYVSNDRSFIINAEINDIRNQSILDNVEGWEMSVVRFDVNSTLIPPAIIPMPLSSIPGTMSPSDLTFTMVYLGVDYTLPVMYENYNTKAQAGIVFTYDNLISAFNRTLNAIFALIPPGPTQTTPPTFVYDSKSQLISMYFEEAWAFPGEIELWSNTDTHNKLFGFPVELFAGFNQPSGKDFKYSFNSSGVENCNTLVAGSREFLPTITNVILDPMRRLSQEVVATAIWSGVRSIILTTTTLPIQTEYLQNSINASQQESVSSSSSLIISDFLLSSAINPMADRINVEYLPTSEYRMLSLLGNGSISRISIFGYFQLTNGIILPISLPPNGSFSVKLMFRKKN